MKHTTVCGKSADRPIGGPCQRKPRPRTMIETKRVWSPPTATLDWLVKVSCKEKAEKETRPSHALLSLVRLSKQAALLLSLIGPQIFTSTSITRISSCKLENHPTTESDWSVESQVALPVYPLGSRTVNSARCCKRSGVWRCNFVSSCDGTAVNQQTDSA